MACLAVPYFSTLSYKRHDFRKIVIELKMWVLIFFTNLFETFLSPRIIQLDITVNVPRYSCKVAVILSGFNATGIFSTDFRETLQYQLE
jgi:hypothetical protein